MALAINPNLSGKVVVITGAGGVLFSELARECGRQKMKVAVLDLSLPAAQKTADQITSNGGDAIAIECNILDIKSVEAACETVIKKYDHVDILYNGAGGNNPRGTTTKETYEEGDENNKEIQSFFDMEVDGFKFVFDLNFIGKFNTIKVFIKHMLNRDCAIINTSSMASFAPMTKVPAYAAAYAAVNNFTKWLAVHFAPTHVRINSIAPGFFLTEQNRALLQTKDGQWTPRTKKILAATPMDRLGEPKELLGTILWLMDKEASGFVTGIVVPIDGGFQAYSGV